MAALHLTNKACLQGRKDCNRSTEYQAIPGTRWGISNWKDIPCAYARMKQVMKGGKSGVPSAHRLRHADNPSAEVARTLTEVEIGVRITGSKGWSRRNDRGKGREATALAMIADMIDNSFGKRWWVPNLLAASSHNRDIGSYSGVIDHLHASSKFVTSNTSCRIT
jgi:hypothetical protein